MKENIKNMTIRKRLKEVAAYCSAHTMLITCLGILIYFVVAQGDFLRTGDAWAEGLPEYLGEAVGLGWDNVFAPSKWIGYMTLIPSILSKLYVSFGMPIGFIDVFYRFVVLAFVTACIGFVAHPVNRELIKSDVLRVMLAFGLTLLLSDVSAVSFINVWYVGFVPLLLLTLNPAKLPPLGQVAYTIFGILVALSKPSVVLIPFVVYRAIKTKEYISNGLVLVALLWQTYLLLGANSGTLLQIFSSVPTILMLVGVGVLKLLHIAPDHVWYVVCVDLLLFVGLIILWRLRGLWTALLLLGGLLYSAYNYVVAAVGGLSAPGISLQEVYAYSFKAQQELVMNIFLMIVFFLLVQSVLEYAKKNMAAKYQIFARTATALVVIGVLVAAYRPIDAYRAVAIDDFRQSLNVGQPVCVPLAVPSPLGLDTGWKYDNKRACVVQNGKLSPDYQSFNVPIFKGTTIAAQGQPGRSLNAILLPFKADAPASITLVDEVTGIAHTVIAQPARNGFGLVAVNLADLSERGEYRFTVTSDKPTTYLGKFKESEMIAHFAYLIELPAREQ